MKPKGPDAALIVAMGKPKKKESEEQESNENEEYSKAKKSLAKEIASAVKSGDADKLAMALEDFIATC